MSCKIRRGSAVEEKFLAVLPEGRKVLVGFSTSLELAAWPLTRIKNTLLNKI
jgi:hypothetical protein